jgi:hypothetical protein
MSTYPYEHNPSSFEERFYSDIDIPIKLALIDIHMFECIIWRHYHSWKASAVELDFKSVRPFGDNRLCVAYCFLHVADKKFPEAFFVHPNITYRGRMLGGVIRMEHHGLLKAVGFMPHKADDDVPR